MDRCFISEQIAIHCSQPEQEVYVCWNCSEEVDSDDDLQEVKTKYDGYQSIAECCIDHYITEGV